MIKFRWGRVRTGDGSRGDRDGNFGGDGGRFSKKWGRFSKKVGTGDGFRGDGGRNLWWGRGTENPGMGTVEWTTMSGLGLALTLVFWATKKEK